MQPVQCRMARVALRWGIRDLARKANKSPTTIAKFEGGEEVLADTIAEIQAALEKGGIEILPEGRHIGKGGPGVRFRK